jgi:hypothetical protein
MHTSPSQLLAICNLASDLLASYSTVDVSCDDGSLVPFFGPPKTIDLVLTNDPVRFVGGRTSERIRGKIVALRREN